jgi:xylose isomerase
MIIWPGGEGYNYPFQVPHAEVWARLIDGIADAASALAEKGRLLFLEHKNSEPAMKVLMRNVGMTLHVIDALRSRGITNVQVNMD